MAIINPWTVMAAGKATWDGYKWVKKIKKLKKTGGSTITNIQKKSPELKKLQEPSKLSKKVTKHADTQKVRAQIADPKKKFPTADKIKKSGIKLKDLDPKPSREGITQVKYGGNKLDAKHTYTSKDGTRIDTRSKYFKKIEGK